MLSRYNFTEPLGSGSFGNVFKAIDGRANELVAVKVEQLEADTPSALMREAAILVRLKDVKGVPKLLEYFTHVDRAYLVVELLGAPVLTDLRQRTYSVPRACSIVHRVLKVLRRIHSRGVLHRDIKPQNMLFGIGTNRRELYLIDFNLSSVFRTKDDRLDKRRMSTFVGTRLFSSANAFAGNEQSRRDDLEGLCNVLVWLIKQELPWCYMTGSEYQVAEIKKLTASVTDIARGCPKEVHEMLRYVRSLRYEDEPDYVYMASLLSQMRRGNRGGFIEQRRLSLTEESEDEPDMPAELNMRRSSLSAAAPMPDLETTPKLKPPEVTLLLRARIKSMQESGSVILPKSAYQ